MTYARDYGEQIRTGKLCLELIPDHYKWSFMRVWERIDHILRINLDLDNPDIFQTNQQRYAKIMRMIFETDSYDQLIRNVYHAKLLYQDELGPVILKGYGLDWLSLPNLVKETSPFNGNYCPCCKQRLR